MREGDAAPDEIAVVPDPSPRLDERSRAQSQERAPSAGSDQIPKMVVEESPDTAGSVDHEEDKAMRRADAPPDVRIHADGTEVKEAGEGETGSTGTNV